MVLNIMSLVIALGALVLSGFSWRATHKQALEAERSRLLLEDQLHEQSKPDLRLDYGPIPDQGWILVQLWCPVAFDSATLTLPNEYLNNLFAGLGPGPADPHRLEYSPTFDLPATAAGSTVSCGLWVYQASKLAGETFRILCEVKSGGRSWNYVKEHTVDDPNLY
jgi:hypothetical protein